MKVLFLIHAFLLFVIPLSYSQCQITPQQALTVESSALITTKVLNGMRNMSDERDGINERLRQSEGIVDGYLHPNRKDIAVIFNDLVSPKFAAAESKELTLTQYLKNLLLYKAVSTWDPKEEWSYRFGKTTDKKDWVEVLLRKSVQFTHPKYAKLQQNNLLGFRYLLDDTPNRTPKLVGISVFETMPADAFKISAAQLAECKNKGLNLETACNTLVNEALSQYKSRLNQGPLRLYKFTYNEKGITNELSDLMTNYTKKSMEASGMTQKISLDSENPGDVKIKGYFAKSLDKLKMSMVIISPARGDSVTVAIDELPVKWLSDNNLSYIPADYQNAVAVQNTLKEGALPSVNSSFQFQIRTDKGHDGVEIRKGEVMRVYVKSSKPCYVRLIDLLSDGTKVLLHDNFEIKAEDVNKEIMFPTILECDAPFGQEYLVGFAASDPFAPLPITEKDGYSFISGPLDNILKKTRGLKVKMLEDKIQVISRAK